jgi:proton-coupled amino acid transporter
MTRNFVSFSRTYGSFAGVDLAESEDETAIEDESRPVDEPNETRSLLGRRKSSRRAKKPSDASTT